MPEPCAGDEEVPELFYLVPSSSTTVPLARGRCGNAILQSSSF